MVINPAGRCHMKFPRQRKTRKATPGRRGRKKGRVRHLSPGNPMGEKGTGIGETGKRQHPGTRARATFLPSISHAAAAPAPNAMQKPAAARLLFARIQTYNELRRRAYLLQISGTVKFEMGKVYSLRVQSPHVIKRRGDLGIGWDIPLPH